MSYLEYMIETLILLVKFGIEKKAKNLVYKPRCGSVTFGPLLT